jgi:hypothetical protein
VALEASLARKKREALPPRDQRLVDYALEALASEA